MNGLLHWKEIEGKFRDGSLILGNGASISVCEKFDYESLTDKVIEKDVDHDFEKLLQTLRTRDLELIMRDLLIARHIDEAVENRKNMHLSQVYTHCESALMGVIRDVHPTHSEVNKNLKKMRPFLETFCTIVSLNYDLLLYWTMMQNMGHFRDGFSKGKENNQICFSSSNFQRMRGMSMRGMRASNDNNFTVVFYQYGNLALAQHWLYAEEKKLE